MGKGKSGWEEFSTGFVIAAVFGILWLRGGSWIWIFPAAFAGVMPMMHGLQKVLVERSNRRGLVESRRRRPEESEREVLRLARSHGGVLTPSLVALESDLSIAEAEKILEGLAARGHSSVEVRANGRIEYEFAEFKPRLESPYDSPGEQQ